MEKRNVDAALNIARALADTIRDLGSVPSGHLYAQVMGHLDIHTYEAAIGALKRAGLVTEKNHELTWVGPAKEQV